MTNFTDGEWHRLHPATPLLKGGLALIAIIGVIVVNLRDQLLEGLLGGPNEDDPFRWLTESGLFWAVALGVLGVLVLFVLGFYLSWRMHSFRITDKLVEVRSGILFRTNRRAPLDRIQDINIARPFIPRLVGAAKLEINVAGNDAKVQLAYLGSAIADELRAEVLRLASGTQNAAAQAPAGSGDVIRDRVAELLAPELDPKLAPPQSVVTMNLGRALGSILLSDFTIVLILVMAGFVVGAIVSAQPAVLVPILPAIFAMGSYYSKRFSKSLRFTIASTTDGIRIGYGLLSTANETLPPGRIHSVQVSQPFLWRVAGWWEVKVNRASKSSAQGASNQANTTILPVGSRADVMRVLALVLPTLESAESLALLEAGLVGRGAEGDGYANSPQRGGLLRWFSWRRNGIALVDDAALLRTGAIWRQLVIVPLARLQSVSLELGWLRRRLRLATLRLHTVAGPIRPEIGAVDDTVARIHFDRISAAAVLHGGNDTSHRWRAHD